MNDITFLQLLDDSTSIGKKINLIEIPIIQRDYAQGRDTNDVQRKLADFLADIKNAVECGEPMSMNFIYGKTASEGRFVPLDGQQRLTLLFLLHIYAFSKDDSKTDVLLRFSYDTRESSRMFVKKLVERRHDLFNDAATLPEALIRDSSWFHPQWRHDPTIQSMLAVLDAIHCEFQDTPNLAEALEDNVVSFKFLDMDDLGMEDTLYIKLNARGKALSDFENFRAGLVDRVIDIGDESFSDKFKTALDGDWTDLIWSGTRGQSAIAFDDAFLSIIHNILFNCTKDRKWHGTRNHPKELKQIDKATLEILYYTFGFLKELSTSDRFSEIPFAVWLKNDSNTPPLYEPTYWQRTLLHAVSVYATHSRGKADAPFWDWYRIVRNLTLNSDIGGDNFSSILDSLNELSSVCGNAIRHFAEAEKLNIKGFASLQVEEERLKAQLIFKSPHFADAVIEAEAHRYFSGQIGSVLAFADFSLDDDIDLESKEESFRTYWEVFVPFFGPQSPVPDGLLLRRALLTLGDYRMPTSSYKTLVTDDPGKATSWKALLATSVGRTYMKQLFDLLKQRRATRKDEIETVLQEMISTSHFEDKDWRYYVVTYEELLGKNHISHVHWQMRENSDLILLLSTKTSGGYNYELFTLALELLLRKRGKSCYATPCCGQWSDYWLDGITLPGGESLRVLYIKGYGLAIMPRDEEVLIDPFNGRTVDDVIEYLEKHGY